MIKQGFLLLVLVISASLPASTSGASTKILVSSTSQESRASLVSVAEIEAVGLQNVHAYHPYEKRSNDYQGVWMQDFVARFGDQDISRLTIRAIDDYEITFEREEWQAMRILIATRINDRHVDFDEKGPMFIVFPDYDDRNEVYQINLPKWIWMITEISME